ncbi:MAG: methylamine dehydrogenase light chain [Pseudomonadales bacterium]|nr:methylamine dehydrogenase light chain [Pseudomonadales bacterium]
MDRLTAGTSRLLANSTSRRSFLGRFGAGLAGMGAFPMLPVFREAAAAAEVPELGDPNSCDYWRYCAFSGSLCGCCGGSPTQCPPGSETASVAWVGTCHNPSDGKDYLISYNDCCGKSSCGRCGCHRSEGDKPVYFPSKSNSILWCFGASSHAYHCTLSLVIGEAESTAG